MTIAVDWDVKQQDKQTKQPIIQVLANQRRSSIAVMYQFVLFIHHKIRKKVSFIY